MRTLFALVAVLGLGHSLAQVSATSHAINPGLIFDLLGTANAVKVGLSGEVRHVFVAGIRKGEVLVDAARVVSAESDRLVATAGALTGVLDCPLLLFVDLELLRPSGRAGSRSRACLSSEAGSLVRTGSSPLTNVRGSLELPLNTWLAVEAAGVPASSSVAEQDDLGESVVFYLYLSSEEGDALPDLPTYENWDELFDAFRRGGH